MRLSSTGVALGLALQASTIQAALKPTDKLRTHSKNKIMDGLRANSYYGEDNYKSPPKVPSYNISMPLDHFNASDSRTYNNQFWVNDTYYKPGGPVIFYDFGETSVDDSYAGAIMGGWLEYELEMQTAPMELAKARNGVVIGWEHRYYGKSAPFAVSREYTDDSDIGLPVGGAASLKYLTVEQALEDVAYFARRFNQTLLGGRNKVIGGANGTQHLGPSQAPWIWVGASYPGIRGTWMRLHNPDIIYAVWASSAPVQIVPDGSAYSNAVYRALPSNCTADIQAAVGRMDEIVESGNKTRMRLLGGSLYTAFGGDFSPSYYGSGDSLKDFLAMLFELMIDGAQSYGYSVGLQSFCDDMEGFDTATFLSNSTAHPDDPTVFSYNSGHMKPSDKGIAASNGERGAEAAMAAYLFAVNDWFYGGGSDDYYSKSRRSILKRRSRLSRSKSKSKRDYYDDDDDDDESDYVDYYSQDAATWEWQVLSELGLIISVNGSSPLRLGSKFVDYDYMRNYTINSYFSSLAPADIPAVPDNEYPMAFQGWKMQVSNTMFTAGEFDPWRAYGVFSQETELADYPAYGGVEKDVPACGLNTAAIQGHFGTIYPGAVHAEDMFSYPESLGGSQNLTDPPMKVGLALFQKALDVWLPCFNDTSKTKPSAVDPNNPSQPSSSLTPGPTETPGDKKGAAGGMCVSNSVLAVAGVLSFLFHHAL